MEGSSSTNNQPKTNGVPSSSTFSFKAPYPVSPASPASVSALKQRRVSLASPSSPRVVQPWSFRDEMGLDSQNTEAASSSRTVPEKKGKIRKIDTSEETGEKKQRKKWSQEETQMLVNGCQIHGVGNWKTILQDPDLQFHDRTAVDLKDRFRTYFPDAYKKHYPNAKTHLSSKIRSTFPDGSSLFEKTRSKRRRPFTEAEDRALKAGYEKHGTTWAMIVKDPIFQEQSRRSTDLRDRFRNAFPHLYQAAGYKPRNASKKKLEGPVRAADDQTAGPIRSRRKAQSSQGLLRGGTKSVPQSTACSEDEGSSDEEEESPFKKPPIPTLVDNGSTSMPSFRTMKSDSPSSSDASTSASTSSAATPAHVSTGESYMDADDEMELITIETDSLNIPDFMPNDTHSDMETWSSGINTPTHSSTAAWSTAAASPTSSHVSDFLMNAGASNNPSNASSPYIQRRNDVLGNNLIGKSAWGQDWFSPNPRLDASSASSNSSSSFIDASFSPSSPFSFQTHLNHGVLDRYDLFPLSMPNDIMSEAGLGDSHNTFPDERGAGGSSGGSASGTGFKGYHSQFAGDLISGVGARHGHQQPFSSLSLANMYGFGGDGNEILGLGLEGIPEDAGIHPMQLHSHTSSFSAIEELGLTGISLNDHPDSSSGSHNHNTLSGDVMDDGTMEDVIDMNFGMVLPDKQQQGKETSNEPEDQQISEPFDLDDLVDMSNELHATPPATPLLTQPRPLRRQSAGSMLTNFDNQGMSSGHARSISVPPTEARNGGGGNGGVPMSMDDVGLHMHSHSYSSPGQGHHNQPSAQPEMNMGKGLQALFGLPLPSQLHSSRSSFVGSSNQRQSRNTEPMRLTNSTGSMQPPMSPPMHTHHQQQQQQRPQPQPQQSPQPATLFPAHLLLSSASSSGISTPASPHSHSQNDVHPQGITRTHTPTNDPWRLSSSSATWMNPNTISSSDLYNVPYLDLHYTAYGSLSIPGQNGMSLGNLDAALDGHSDAARQGQALDLAQSAVLAASGLSLTSLFGLGHGHGQKAAESTITPSPMGTIRAHNIPTGLGLGVSKQQSPPTTSFASVAAALAAAAVVGNDADTNGGNIAGASKLDLGSGTGTIRQSHFRQNGAGGGSGSGGLGRSMSHHRGQSAVCPQDLMLRNDNNKRKRASWDGGLV